ncbi:GNAT family N-acetyltransferase [Deinococcus aestuarii]|uniref:GNAT family N-acetyltransferase n=1 Tax=Deinococcus aestuarii TaxID=2774531 RepID=UPI001C0DE6EE|nr:GNAT family N-acetyltransferase [Deinococcus aestuarii]
MIRARPWTRADLRVLEPLLAASFGRSDFDLADELDYFPDPVPPGWLTAWGGNAEPLGLLRFFPAGNGVRVAELYAVPGPLREGVWEALLRGLVSAVPLVPGERLRFDLARDNIALRTLLGRVLEVVAVHEYLRLEREVEGQGQPPRPPLAPEDAQAAAEVLSALKPSSPDTLRALFAQGDLTLSRRDGRVVGAAHVEGRGEGEREVVTFAVRPGARGTGEGARLLHALLAGQPAGTRRLTLQVREDNHAACRLYVREGFRERPRGREVWLLTRLPQPG